MVALISGKIICASVNAYQIGITEHGIKPTVKINVNIHFIFIHKIAQGAAFARLEFARYEIPVHIHIIRRASAECAGFCAVVVFAVNSAIRIGAWHYNQTIIPKIIRIFGEIFHNVICGINKQFTVSVITILKTVNRKGTKQSFTVVTAAVYNKGL